MSCLSTPRALRKNFSPMGSARHLVVVQKPRRSRYLGRGRQKAFQPVRRHTGESRKASARKKGARPSLHRLANFAGGTKGHRRLQNQRRTIVLSERERPERVMRGGTAGCFFGAANAFG